MKEQIERLNLLALDFVDYGIGVGLPDGHHNITHTHEMDGFGIVVNLYFSNNAEMWSVIFDDIEIKGYNNTIEFPLDSTAESLERVYVDCKKYLDYLVENVAKVKYATLKEKAKKIQDLKKQIDDLRRY